MSLASNQEIDVLTAAADDLRHMLEAGDVTSVEIVRRYLKQISDYNEKIRAVLHVSADMVETAEKLDEERVQGHVRGPLHGIPIIVKVP